MSLDGGPDIIASEEIWSKERLSLQQTLKRGEEKVCELKAELLHQNQSPDSGNPVFRVHTSLWLNLINQAQKRSCCSDCVPRPLSSICYDYNVYLTTDL